MRHDARESTPLTARPGRESVDVRGTAEHGRAFRAAELFRNETKPLMR